MIDILKFGWDRSVLESSGYPMTDAEWDSFYRTMQGAAEDWFVEEYKEED